MRCEVHTATGLLIGARQVLSPHLDERPPGTVADLLVLHGISLPPGEFHGPWIDRLFTGSLPPTVHPYFAQIAGARVSAHVLIRRDGELVQYVPFGQRAWHAGASQFEGRTACNDFSIGVEFEGTDDSRYEEAQYAAAAELLRALLRAYPDLKPQRIVGHSDIAPGRKTDPGESFDWAKMRALLG
ncbi:MAG TPA: 1,6-anhydro-N-acetylmuramyl-L-alanine amidase AmpD [Steroidobacteraceae bacterium]|nr:1,6-anhydro-N-acetylmuramyl-L-alanine amidase AmpD [Steroidobacteraceae bacterium]